MPLEQVSQWAVCYFTYLHVPCTAQTWITKFTAVQLGKWHTPCSHRQRADSILRCTGRATAIREHQFQRTWNKNYVDSHRDSIGYTKTCFRCRMREQKSLKYEENRKLVSVFMLDYLVMLSVCKCCSQASCWNRTVSAWGTSSTLW